METFYLLVGVVLIAFAGIDFFYTTLSGSGAFYFTRGLLTVSRRLQMGLARVFGRPVFQYSGLIVNLTLLISWGLAIWLGLFLIFSSSPESIVTSKGRVATPVERLYFTGYVLSTLGLGDFKPISSDFKLTVGALSFFGFAFFSTSMTYLLSISSAAVEKRTLSLAVEALGSHPVEIVRNLLAVDRGMAYQQITSLQNMVERHCVNHRTYPALLCYNSVEPTNTISLNIALLDEAVGILLNDKKQNLTREIRSLSNALDNLLEHFCRTYAEPVDSEMLCNVDWSDFDLPDQLELRQSPMDEKRMERRRVLLGMLRSDCLDWNDVYPDMQNDRPH